MNTAIIVAAGSGTRFASETPKQFHELAGKPVLAHAVAAFEECAAVDAIIVVISPSDRRRFESIRERFPISKLQIVVDGGATRAESVRNGLSAATPETSVVCVHDGARPLVTIDDIVRTIEKATDVGAACLAVGVTDTIKQVDGDRIVATVDRRDLRRAVTPQAFRYDVLLRAFEKGPVDESISDESMLVERTGDPVAFVSGSSRNIKITHRDDIAIAEALLKLNG